MSASSVPLFKRCTKCGEEKPATTEYFARNTRRNPNGLQPKCKACNAAYRVDNDDRLKDYFKDHYQKNRDRIITRLRRDPERVKRVKRIRYERKREELRAKEKAYRESNREKIRERERLYHKKNPHVKRLIDNRRRSRVNGAEESLTKIQWERCLEYFKHKCAVCGRPQGLWHVLAQDHWIPVTAKGGFCVSNIIPLCHGKKDGTDGCNNSKKDKPAEQWLTSKFGKKKAKHILARINAYFEWAKKQE